MRFLALVLLTLPLWGLSNAVTITATSEVPAWQVHRVPRWFAKGEIGGYPQPFVANVAAAEWQADVKNRWADGSVRYALVHFTSAIAASGSITVDFRNSADACHLGNQATCEAAGLNGAGMLAFGGGTWDAEMRVSADPAGATTAHVPNARTMLAANQFTYWLRGPLVTSVIAEDASVDRVYDFGWAGAGCTAPYDTCTWADDTTHRSLHPIFVLTFNQGAGVKIEYILANYWTSKRQDQRYSVEFRTSAGAVFTKSGIRGIASAWWRKVFWDGADPVATNTDFNMEYLRHSKMIPPYRYPFGPITETAALGGQTSINGTLAAWAAGTNSDFPFACTLTGVSCGLRTRTYSATGGRGDRGFYPAWEAQWLYTQRKDLYDIVIGNAEYVTSQPHHLRELVTGLPNYRGSTPAFGMPISLNTRPTTNVNLYIYNTTNLPAAVGPISGSQNTWSGWAADGAHRHTHVQLAYLVTGDWFFMQEQSFLAHHLFFWAQQVAHQAGQRKGTWGFIRAEETNHRQVAWHTWNIWRASLIVPDADPQHGYIREKLNDALAQHEGYYGITNGDYYEPCSTNPYDPVTDTSKWCHGFRVEGQANRNPNRHSTVIGSAAQRGGQDTSIVAAGSSPWMDTFVALAYFDLCRGEGLACAIAKHHAERYEKASTDTGSNPVILRQYHYPVRFNNGTTLTANIGADDTTIPVADGSACGAPPFVIWAGENILIVAVEGNNMIAGSTWRGGRGYNATSRGARTAGTSVSCPRPGTSYAELVSAYTSPLQSVLVSHDVLMSDNGSYSEGACAAARWSSDFLRTARASEVWSANCHTNELVGPTGIYSSYSDPRWLFDPDRPVQRVRVSVAEGTATLRYVAPSGAACRVYVGTAPPATSDDGADPADTANGRLHTFTAAGLSAGTHQYRVSCGVVRATGTFVVQ
jgi:hypothetical protein